MGVIQQGINQLLGTAAIAARLNPELEMKAQERVLKKEGEKLEQKSEALGKNLREGYSENERAPVSKEQEEEVKNLVKSNVELSQKEYDLNPNEETLRKLLQNKKTLNNLEAGDKAQQRAQQKGQQQLKQKRKFSDYLSKLETSFGGTVGDLPKSIQQTIAKQYSSKERREIMNRMDKEDKK